MHISDNLTTFISNKFYWNKEEATEAINKYIVAPSALNIDQKIYFLQICTKNHDFHKRSNETFIYLHKNFESEDSLIGLVDSLLQLDPFTWALCKFNIYDLHKDKKIINSNIRNNKNQYPISLINIFEENSLSIHLIKSINNSKIDNSYFAPGSLSLELINSIIEHRYQFNSKDHKTFLLKVLKQSNLLSLSIASFHTLMLIDNNFESQCRDIIRKSLGTTQSARKEKTQKKYWSIYCVIKILVEQHGMKITYAIKQAESAFKIKGSIQPRYYEIAKTKEAKKHSIDELMLIKGIRKEVTKILEDLNLIEKKEKNNYENINKRVHE